MAVLASLGLTGRGQQGRLPSQVETIPSFSFTPTHLHRDGLGLRFAPSHIPIRTPAGRFE